MALVSTTPQASRGHVARSLALLAGIALAATGCSDHVGSLQPLSGVNTTFCAPAAGFESIGSALPIHVPQNEDEVQIESIEPLNDEGIELGESKLVPMTTEGARGYGEFGANLVEEGRGEWGSGQDAEGASIEPGENASLVIESRASHGGEEASLAGYRITYSQGGEEHTVTVRQGIEVKADGGCPPIENGGDGQG